MLEEEAGEGDGGGSGYGDVDVVAGFELGSRGVVAPGTAACFLNCSILSL